MSKAWVWGRSTAVIKASHPAGGMTLVYCQVVFSETSRFLIQRNPTVCVSLSVIRCSSNRLQLQSVGVKGWELERKMLGGWRMMMNWRASANKRS